MKTKYSIVIERLLAFSWAMLLHRTCWKCEARQKCLLGKRFSPIVLEILGANMSVKVLSNLGSSCCWLRKRTQ